MDKCNIHVIVLVVESIRIPNVQAMMREFSTTRRQANPSIPTRLMHGTVAYSAVVKAAILTNDGSSLAFHPLLEGFRKWRCCVSLVGVA